VTEGSALTVMCCRNGDSGGRAANLDAPREPAGITAAIASIIAACSPHRVQYVGRRPGKEIDRLLTGRVLVVGDDADLAAVAQRLLRRDLLESVEIAYAAPSRTPVTDLWALPHGAPAVELARTGEVDPVPLVRDDVGGVLVAAGSLQPVDGTVYVDQHRVLGGPAHRIEVEPDPAKGLAVTIIHRRLLGLGRRSTTTLGRAVQIGTTASTVVRDGVPYPRQMDRWTFYKHTQPLRLIRGLP
jgi:hypothetical protein